MYITPSRSSLLFLSDGSFPFFSFIPIRRVLPVLLFYSYQTGSSRSSLLFLSDGFFPFFSFIPIRRVLPVLLFYSYQTGSSRSSLLFLSDGFLLVLLFNSYETFFFLSQKLAKVTRITETKSFHLIFWYVEDALSINNTKNC